MYAVNYGPITCPARSFFIFVHNQPIPDLKENILVKTFKGIKNKKDLFTTLEKARQDPDTKHLIPKNYDLSRENKYDILEFEQSFY